MNDIYEVNNFQIVVMWRRATVLVAIEYKNLFLGERLFYDDAALEAFLEELKELNLDT